MEKTEEYSAETASEERFYQPVSEITSAETVSVCECGRAAVQIDLNYLLRVNDRPGGRSEMSAYPEVMIAGQKMYIPSNRGKSAK